MFSAQKIMFLIAAAAAKTAGQVFNLTQSTTPQSAFENASSNSTDSSGANKQGDIMGVGVGIGVPLILAAGAAITWCAFRNECKKTTAGASDLVDVELADTKDTNVTTALILGNSSK